MQMDMVADWWLWFAAAGMALVLVASFAAYYFLRPQPKAENEIEDHATGKWIATGRIDLTDPQNVGNFVLQAEDTRVVESLGGVEHREIRWRKATLDEAKRVVMAYHTQRNLTTRANFVVTSPRALERGSDEAIERQGSQVEKDRKVEKSDTAAVEGAPALDSSSI